MEQCDYCDKVDCDGCIWLKFEVRLKPRPKHKMIIVSAPDGGGWFYERYNRSSIDGQG